MFALYCKYYKYLKIYLLESQLSANHNGVIVVPFVIAYSAQHSIISDLHSSTTSGIIDVINKCYWFWTYQKYNESMFLFIFYI